jgi:hypothetical protein
MTKGQLWVEIRYRLVVVGIAAMVLAGGWMAGGSSIHFGPSPPYEDPDSYVGHLLYWFPGQAALIGRVDSHSDIDCPSVVGWLRSDDKAAFVGIGPVAARAHAALWAASALDPQRHPVPLGAKPKISFYCYR